MSDDLLDQLVAYGSFHRLHQSSVTVAEVVEPRTERVPDVEARLPRRPRRWLIAAAAAVAVVLLVAATVLLVDSRHNAVRTKPATQNPAPTTLTAPTTTPGDDSTTGPLLPEGAPSMPPSGELVAEIGIRHRGGYRLYADGRLIRIWDFVEQRLSPEGVERVRSRFLSSGLFDSAPPLSDVTDCPLVHASVRDGDHWLCVQVDVGGPSPSLAPPEAVQLFDDLDVLDSTLPATAWADPQVKPYVPALIGTCVSMYVNGAPAPLDRSVLVSRLPEQAAGVLAAHEPSAEVAMSMAAAGNIFRPYGPGGPPGRDPTSAPEGGCFALPLDEARMLADALLPPSGDGAHERWGIVRSFGAQPDPARPGATRDESAYIYFDQLMPDGVPFGSFGD